MKISLATGIFVWLSFSILSIIPDSAAYLQPDMLETVLLFHILVLLPAGIIIINQAGPFLDRTWHVSLQLIAGVCAVLALVPPWSSIPSFLNLSGTLPALILAGPYFIFAMLLSSRALRNFKAIQHLPWMKRLSLSCLYGSCFYLLVGAFFLLMAARSVAFGGFSVAILKLTAIHFHYAGFSALLVVASARMLMDINHPGQRALYTFIATGSLAGPALTGLGIAWSPTLEVAGSFFLLLAMLALSLVLFIQARKLPGRIYALLFLAASSLFVAMSFALLFILARFMDTPLISVLQMLRTHGMLNSFLFTGIAMLALLLWQPDHGASEPPPFSRLSAHGPVRPDFFARRFLSEETVRAHEVKGLCESMSQFNAKHFQAEKLHAAVRNFYENTAQYELVIHAMWNPFFKGPAIIYKRFSSWMGQMNFPVNANSPDAMHSRIIKLKDERDGRTNVRAWVRTYQKTAENIYAAAYASHKYEGVSYMNIAFPHLFGNLTSILYLFNDSGHASGQQEHGIFEQGGLILRSWQPADCSGDHPGIYWCLNGAGFRLPMREEIRILPAKSAKGTIEKSPAVLENRLTCLAEHDMFLFGKKFLHLQYLIYKKI
jgi:hypothetical protein